MTCTLCDGSGTLKIVSSTTLHPDGRLVEDAAPYISWCHACPAGEAWRDAGLDRDTEEDGVDETDIPYLAIGNSEPLPEGLPPALAEAVRASRRQAGWCDHGRKLGTCCT